MNAFTGGTGTFIKLFLVYFSVLSLVVNPFKFPDEIQFAKEGVLEVGKKVAKQPLRFFSRIADRILDQVNGPSAKAKLEKQTKKSLVSQDVNQVRFVLYDNPNNPSAYTELKIGDANLVRSTNLVRYKQTKILIHGFRNNFNSEFPQVTKNVYLEHTDYNVICVDWGPLAKPNAQFGHLFYPFVADNVPRVAERVADFIMFLRKNDLISSLGLIHIVGFSLGAHVAGVAGRHIFERTAGFRVGRITGLDPAGPNYLTARSENRLDEPDADFVDVIHTNEGQLGFIGRLGHADFYPNGGSHQPFCIDTNEGRSEFFNSLNQALSGSCSHYRAAIYFTKSIPTKQVVACKCSSWLEFRARCRYSCDQQVVFGENCLHNARGKYYLELAE